MHPSASFSSSSSDLPENMVASEDSLTTVNVALDVLIFSPPTFKLTIGFAEAADLFMISFVRFSGGAIILLCFAFDESMYASEKNQE
jgi:hypothetical protein